MTDTETPAAAAARTSRLISAGAVMAAGTMVSRVLGFGRLMLLVVLFGNGTRQAEMFTLANTVPNSMYILLAGGVLNTVLVPQIVRAIKSDPDRGEAYTNRIMTAGLIALAAITTALTLAVPYVIALYSASGWKEPGVSAQYESMVMLGYYCMPQIFFYGVHVLAGQVLNARDRFGPMMWAPIANNVISILVLVLFLVVFGDTDPKAAFTSGQELLLGVGSTLGIAAQAAVLLPFLRAAGYRFRPRFDFKHTGLGKTFRLAKWTLGFVLITQAALVVVNRLASGATVGGSGAGLAAYYNAYAMWILPHSLVTVSLATAMLPAASRLAAARDLTGVAVETRRTILLSLTALLPAAVAFATLGLPLTRLVFGFGEGAKDAEFVGWALMALSVGLVPFTIQYICLRAFYALENTRTTFFLQVLISATNVALGIAVVLLVDRPSLVAAGLAAAYSSAYVVGVVVSIRRLRRTLPALGVGAIVRQCVRLLIAALPAGAVGWAITYAGGLVADSQPARAVALALAGVAAVATFVGLSRVLHIAEVSAILATLRRRRVPAPAADAAPEQPVRNDPAAVGDSMPEASAEAPTIEEPAEARSDRPRLTPALSEPVRRTSETVLIAESAEPTVTQAPTAPPPMTATLDLEVAGLPDDPDDQGQSDGPGHSDGPAQSNEPAPHDLFAAQFPAGTTLGGRYRLEELLREAPRTVSWRAFDQVLSRSVMIHLLPAGDADTEQLLHVARQASVATDARFLRVLDVAQATGPTTCSYIVCEYVLGQSLEAILTNGPLTGLEAAWVIRELADALAGVHATRLHHERIGPDTVIITPTGNVKIVGLLIEKVLRPTRTEPGGRLRSGAGAGATNGDESAEHGPAEPAAAAETPELRDVHDLGRLLYASLVARWPDGAAYSLPEAPLQGHHWMTPRQVRAGVSPALDQICDQILGEPPRHHADPIRTAVGIVNALTKVLGTADASGDLERRLRQPIPHVRHGAGDTARLAAIDTVDTVDQATEETRPVGLSAATPAEFPLIRQPPPPAERAKSFRPTRVPRSPGGPRTARSRRPVMVVAALVVAVLLIGAAVVGIMAIRSRLGAADPTPSTPAAGSAGPAAGASLAISGARDFDPQADPPNENPGQVRLAVDGDPKTRWTTVTYRGTPRLGNLKRGVGLVVDLGRPQPVRTVRVSLSGSGTTFDVRVPKEKPARTTTAPMSSDARWQVVGGRSGATGTAEVALAAPVTTRFVLVYLRSLPREGGGYRGGIYEIAVFS